MRLSSEIRRLFLGNQGTLFFLDVPDMRWILCMGWALWRSTHASLALIDKVISRMKVGTPNSPYNCCPHDDQLAVNYIIFKELNLRFADGGNPIRNDSALLHGAAAP